MSVIISDEVLQSARITPSELLQEVSILLFQKEKLTLAQAARLAGLDQLRFRFVLAARQIPIHYDVADFESDLETLRALGQV